MTSTLNNAAEIRKIISNKKVRDLHIVSDLKGILSILLEWTLIITCTILSETYFSWYFYPIVVMFLGARYLALGLIMHESVHNLVSKNSFVNDWLSEIFCSWPMLISMRSYKIKHLAHHAWLNTDDDPDFISKADENWQYPMMKYKFLRILITQLSGLGIFETLKVMSSSKMKVKKPKTPLWYHLLRYSFYLTTIGLFLYFDKGLILLKAPKSFFATTPDSMNFFCKASSVKTCLENFPILLYVLRPSIASSIKLDCPIGLALKS